MCTYPLILPRITYSDTHTLHFFLVSHDAVLHPLELSGFFCLDFQACTAGETLLTCDSYG